MKNKTLLIIFSVTAAVFPLTGGRVSKAAEQLKLPTYYTSPYGSYDRLRLVPRDDVLPNPCQVGSLYVGLESVSSTQTRLYYCKDVGAGLDNGEWGTVSGDSYWTEETVGPSNVNLYPKDTLSNPNLNVGIGTITPQSRLHIKGGDLLIEDPSAELTIEDSDANEMWNIGTGSNDSLGFVSCSDCDNISISKPLILRNYSGDIRMGINTWDPAHKLDVTGSTVNIEDISPELSLFHPTDSKIRWTIVSEEKYIKVRRPPYPPEDKLWIGNDGELMFRNSNPSLTFDDTDGNDWRITSEGLHGTYLRFEYREDTVNPAATFVPAVEFGGTGKLALWGPDRGIRFMDTDSYGTSWGIEGDDARPDVLKFVNRDVTLSNGDRYVPCEIGPHGNLTLRPNPEDPEEVMLLLDPNPGGVSDPTSLEWYFFVNTTDIYLHLWNTLWDDEGHYYFGEDGMGIGVEPYPGASLTIADLPVQTVWLQGLYYNNATHGIYSYSPPSSRKMKRDIAPLNDDFYKILDIQPVTFLDKRTDLPGFGVIAEEVDKLGLKNLVIYDQDGAVQSFRYEMVGVYSLPIVKDQQDALEAADRQSAEMSQKLSDLEDRLEKLEKKKQGL